MDNVVSLTHFQHYHYTPGLDPGSKAAEYSGLQLWMPDQVRHDEWSGLHCGLIPLNTRDGQNHRTRRQSPQRQNSHFRSEEQRVDVAALRAADR